MAQLVARLVRNEKVRGSNPLSSTSKTPGQRDVAGGSVLLGHGPRWSHDEGVVPS